MVRISVELCYKFVGVQLIARIFVGSCSGLPIRERIGALAAMLILLMFIAVGIHAVIRPRKHKNGYLRRGGEMLRELNELGVQLGGLLFAGTSGWILYRLIHDVWRRCFS
jgi:hypothetical protein